MNFNAKLLIINNIMCFFVMMFNLRYCEQRARYVWTVGSEIESYRCPLNIPNLCCLSGSGSGSMYLLVHSGWERADIKYTQYQKKRLK